MKGIAKRAWHGFKAAVTSPTAVEQEKNLAVFIVTRVIIAVGGTAAVVEIVTRLIQGG